MDKALEYVEGNGIMSEEDYPYEAEDGNCRFDASRTVTTISKYLYVKEGDEEELKAAVATVGPISVAVDATGFQFYKQGIYSESYLCGNDLYNLNHGVLVTGYGVSNGDTYWKVKNSWGASWGMDGYILISRNSNNLCGIATDPVYPEL
ncbi:hypothetical protein NQ318_004752 [Aromia moschata]|uniref:Peptidase C1A papain C-terminal domain-containing protein n=1 Tax=Aromia moschata TaxID=1265417 RepID=A0AAV8XY12_9CUCU|nr:hypothetical protein NQ318_004752 [Aromia moschata]